ncbi:ADP-ribosylhydrolase ARH1-like isoform X3 [Zonotrichia albicollis]|uniref:ADP-ribosylhydrolase ARH1-like isoform X3 n=1 Tax=Zonotrichia albicollis TaxID=44394 RepID=UPI003D8113DF
MEEPVPSVEAYEAAMVLSGVGDALGYRGARWEYCTSGPQIHGELAELGGLAAISLEPPEWPVSDDTVLHLATAEGLATGLEGEPLLQELAQRYVVAMGDMEGRKPGPSSILGTSQLRPGEPQGYRIPFNPRGTGCGAAMRSLAIGLRSRGVGTAVMPVQVPTRLRTADSDPGEHRERAHDPPPPHWYLESRGLLAGGGPPRVPSLPSPAERDTEYLRWALDGWAGRSGHDAPMVALEALLAAGDSWQELCARAVLHGGDSDSTGTIAAGCWGLLRGLAAVPPGLHQRLEYRGRLSEAARRLHTLAWGARR